MEVDINEAKSRAFNLLLRFCQLGIQIFVASYISKVDHISCSSTFLTICLPISYILILFNILGILILRCRDAFSRTPFFVALAIDFILAGIVLVMGFAEIGESNSCANNKILHRFGGFEALICLLICGVIMKSPSFEMSQRYTNTPGNAVWIFLFFGFSWTSSFSGGNIAIGVFNLLISLSSLIINIIPLIMGITTRIKKMLLIQWLGSLGLMLICEIIAIGIYLGNSDLSGFEDIVAKKLLQTYLPVNVIDGLFWIYGLLTLAYANGDKIRDMLINENEREDLKEEQEEDNEYNMGTIK